MMSKLCVKQLPEKDNRTWTSWAKVHHGETSNSRCRLSQSPFSNSSVKRIFPTCFLPFFTDQFCGRCYVYAFHAIGNHTCN